MSLQCRRSAGDYVILTDTELRELTRKQRPSAQARALDFMRIPYMRRHDGSLAVFRAHLDSAIPASARLSGPEPALQP